MLYMPSPVMLAASYPSPTAHPQSPSPLPTTHTPFAAAGTIRLQCTRIRISGGALPTGVVHANGDVFVEKFRVARDVFACGNVDRVATDASATIQRQRPPVG